MKKIALLTSGGDSPGMNPAIRAVVRTAIGKGLSVMGVQRGYEGLLAGRVQEMSISCVGNIIQRGGTILQTSRYQEFHQEKVRRQAYEVLIKLGIDGLVVLGGNGSFNGAFKLASENNYPVVGLPCTIDNDITGTQYSVGFDTAVQTAVEAVDKIRDTASSHQRNFIVEVMGRNSSSIATHVGVCTGAEDIIFPQEDPDFNLIAQNIKRGIKRGKQSSILIVAEGNQPGYAYKAQKILREKYGYSSHVCILGYIQRGGVPSSLDRFIAANMGFTAVLGLLNGHHRHVTAFVDGYTKLCPIEECLDKKDDYIQRYMELARTLSI